MTTVLADARLGVMVADTGAGDGDRQWPGTRKVWRIPGALVGFAGVYALFDPFLAWLRTGMFSAAPPMLGASVLVLDAAGLWVFDDSAVPLLVECGREAIGTGAKAALAAHEALGYADARRAVQIACRYDAASRAPVRSYRL
ncbi:MAG: hypothetical protein KGL43_04000 [Burkholderiales bacterium]|nr:hypothetical protein [Burkholderiales bacterium]MDE2452733.1 hypothetical protein [Burkholderiales bacterium]